MRIFLSCVTREFGSYRQRLASHLLALPRHAFEVKVQEDFQQGGFTLLDRLGAYIRECDLVLHLVGDFAGARPSPEHVQNMFARLGETAPDPLPELSYTQWEYELARRFDKGMLCYLAAPEAERDWEPESQQGETELGMQMSHRERIGRAGKDYRKFKGRHDLVRKVFFDLGLSPTDKAGNLPFASIGSLFKGRDEFLLKLRETLDEGRPRGGIRANSLGIPAAVVHGLGGVGKTRAALEFAHWYADEYTAMLFVAADSPVSLESNLAQLCSAAVLDLDEKVEKETTKQVAAVLRWLNRNHGWVLILDNVDSDEAVGAVRKLLASLTGTGEVVITSRFSRWSREVATIELDVLNEASSTSYLLESTMQLRRDEAEDTERAKELAFALGQLALALEQAAAYINAQGISLQDYLERWRSHRDRLLSYHDELATHASHSVAVTWLTSFEQLSGDGRRLLQMLCWLAPEPIPRTLLQAGGGPLGATASSELPAIEREGLILDAEEALGDLWKYSLARSSPDKLTFSVHPLVQDVTRRNLPEANRQPILEAALRWLKAGVEVDPADVRNWPVLEPLASHVLAAANFADRQGDLYPAAWFLNHLGHFFQVKAQWAAAEPLLRRAVAIYEKIGGLNHVYLPSTLNNLAELLRVTNRPNEGEQLLRRTLAILEKSSRPDDPLVTTCLSNLGLLLRDTNRMNEAEPLQRRALAIEEKRLGPEHPNIAHRLNNLAQLLQVMKRPDQAEPLLRRALTIGERSLGSDHPHNAPVINNLATLLHNANRMDEAEPLSRRALAISERSFGPDHPEVAISLNNLAELLEDRKRLDEAETLMRRALSISEKSFGPEHPNVARCLGNLAALLRKADRPDEAEPLMRRNLAILIHSTRSNGYPHPRLRSVRDGYVVLLEEMKVPKGEISIRLREMGADDVPNGGGTKVQSPRAEAAYQGGSEGQPE
jgi:tetratricopeptide (TPR) repeat protein